MSRLPLSREKHWQLLQNKRGTAKFNSVSDSILKDIQDLFGFRLTGVVVSVNHKSYGVGFDLEAEKKNIKSQRASSSIYKQNVFPSYESRNSLSYRCSATTIKNSNSGVDFKTFSNDFSFEHNFRFSKFVAPIILQRFRKKGIYVDKFRNAGDPTMKLISTSDSYIQQISRGMELSENLHEIDNDPF